MAVGQFMKTAAERDYSKHWQLEGTFPWMFQQPKPPIEGNRPISPRDNYIRCVKGESPTGCPPIPLKPTLSGLTPWRSIRFPRWTATTGGA